MTSKRLRRAKKKFEYWTRRCGFFKKIEGYQHLIFSPNTEARRCLYAYTDLVEASDKKRITKGYSGPFDVDPKMFGDGSEEA